MRPGSPAPFAVEDRRPAIVRAGEVPPGCQRLYRRPADPVRERAVLDATRCALAYGSGKGLPYVRSIPQENGYVNSGTIIIPNLIVP